MKISDLNQNRIHSLFVEKSIKEKLASGRKLTIKSGVDPTSTDAHFGHLIGLLVLKEFVGAGHKVKFVIGDFTAQLGDGIKRPLLSLKQTKQNSDIHIKIVRKILGDKNVSIRRHSEWFEDMPLEKFLKFMSFSQLKRLISHGTFLNKLEANESLGFHEVSYPLLMAIDSVILKPDIEIGGLEQKFNLQFARHIMEKSGVPKEDFILNSRLPGIDGSLKMGKSEGNFIGVFEKPVQQIKKIMKIKNEVVPNFFSLFTSKSDKEINLICREVIKSESTSFDIKKELVFCMLSLLHEKEVIENAWKEFESSRGSDLTTMQFSKDLVGVKILDFLVDQKFVSSRREAKRFVEQKAVRVDDRVINDCTQELDLNSGTSIRIGKGKIIEIC